jgi:2-amino-4-hydroxy-6-hydroxymethyldihydropteridine diphosphokinase
VARVYLSLGSNLGDRARTLRAALALLEAPDLHIHQVSSIYETEPLEFRRQPWFLNLVVEAETGLLPKQLLTRVQRIEFELGRRRLRRSGPRAIDIDILFYGGTVMNTPDLKVPHPRLGQRRFVLEPLAELAPELRHPATGLTAAEMLYATRGSAVHRQEVVATGAAL